jgi:glycosyltransferase involved in cell wall biosynthesis
MYPSSFNETEGIFVHEQAKALVEKGIEVRVVSPRPWSPFPINCMSSKWRAYSKVPPQANWEGIDVYYPRYLAFPKSALFASSGKRMYRGIRNLTNQIYQEFPFDLIHAHVALPDGHAAASLASELALPMLVTIHGQDLQQTIHVGVKCRRALAIPFNLASRIVVVSNKLEDLATKHFGSHCSTVVIPNGVNPQEVVGNDSEDLPNRTGALTLLSVSNLEAPKGIDLNIVAVQHLCKRYPTLEYSVIGGGSLETKLQRMVASLKLGSCVNFLGPQNHRNVMKHMARCDIFTLPSWMEGFGIVYLEAMASGKPVIGCRGEGIEDFVDHGKTGLLVKPHDVDSLVDALDFLLSHPEEARRMGERARKFILENYTWEKNAEQTIKVYREVLNESQNQSDNLINHL